MINLNTTNSLLELFFNQYNYQPDKNIILFSDLKEPKKNYSWHQVFSSINSLTSEIKKYLKEGDRCLLISENRPEWFISDMSIMLTKSITVPAYTTYLEKDYKFIIENCEPSIIFVSNLTK